MSPNIKIKKLIEETFPFDETKLRDRFLIAYSVENLYEKFIGFTFESILSDSKVSMYVFMQSRVKTTLEAKVYLQEYLDKVDNFDPEQTQGMKSIIIKIADFLGLTN